MQIDIVYVDMILSFKNKGVNNNKLVISIKIVWKE